MQDQWARWLISPFPISGWQSAAHNQRYMIVVGGVRPFGTHAVR